MKYALRFVWHVAKIAIVAVSAFAILVVAFFIAMDSANVYVIVTDGMKAKAQAILLQNSDVDLGKYFNDLYMKQNPANGGTKYQDYIITDIDYRISVESLWCQPWKNTAEATVVESIPDMSYGLTENNADKDKDSIPAPAWPRARYKIQCKKQNDTWRITSVELVKTLLPEPTPSPEPSSYVTASPVPTTTPTATPQMSISPTASASPTVTR